MKFDDVVFHPKRFVILTVLFLFKEMTEGDLAKAAGMSWGSLSTHLKKLEEKGYIERRKAITVRGVRTVVRITELGYSKYREEVEKLKKVLDGLDSMDSFG